MMSRVTVIMPVHNAASYLQAAIDSVLLQDAPDFKLLIIDDGSDDRSREILELQIDPRVEVVFRPRSGLGAVLNYGINLCTTPYVARMDADDLCAPGRLRLQLAFLESHPDVGAVGTQFIYFADNGRSLPSPKLPLGTTRSPGCSPTAISLSSTRASCFGRELSRRSEATASRESARTGISSCGWVKRPGWRTWNHGSTDGAYIQGTST